MSAGKGLLIVPPGGGVHVGNMELICLSEHTPRFNLGVITVAPFAHGPETHEHAAEDDSFYVLDGELTLHGDDGEVTVPAGTFVLAPPGVRHTFSNPTDRPVRVLNVHAPAGFDLRLMADD